MAAAVLPGPEIRVAQAAKREAMKANAKEPEPESDSQVFDFLLGRCGLTWPPVDALYPHGASTRARACASCWLLHQEYVVKEIHEIKMGFESDGQVLIRIVRVEWADVCDDEKWSWEPAYALTETDAYKKFMAKPAQMLWRDPGYKPDIGRVKPGPHLNQNA